MTNASRRVPEGFPEGLPVSTVPLAENITADEPDVYFDALCAYFRADSCPYSRWFNAYEPFLNGMGASYYGGQPSTALHTDICSPVATAPHGAAFIEITDGLSNKMAYRSGMTC